MEAMVWEGVMELTKWAQEKKTDPLLWSIQVSAALNSAGVSLPSVDLAHRLVSYICFDNHVPLAWKLLEKAMAVRILPPLLALSLLSTRVLPHRHLHPAAYALYIDLLNRHAFSLSSNIHFPQLPQGHGFHPPLPSLANPKLTPISIPIVKLVPNRITPN